jgi:hypothetical protein
VLSIQVGINQTLSILHLAYVISIKPFEARRLNNIEIMNEIFLMALTYSIFLFSAWVTDFNSEGEDVHQKFINHEKQAKVLWEICKVDRTEAFQNKDFRGACQRYQYGEAHRFLFYLIFGINALEIFVNTLLTGIFRKCK